jgi:ABC-2 type transport system ATP-binding protein
VTTGSGLVLEQVSVVRSRQRIVSDISVEATSGVLGLAGPNGSGKSTVLAAIAGVLPISAGRILVDGIPVERGTLRAVAGRVGYAPQSMSFPRRMTVADVCAYAAWLRCVPRGSIPRKIDAAMSDAGLAGLAECRVGRLSGGQRRRLSLAQALVHDPPVLVLDEPTSELDPEHRVAFRDTVARLAQDRLIVLSTHILEDLYALDAFVVLLAGGCIRFARPVSELIAGVAGQGDPVTLLDRAYAKAVG